MSAVCGKQRSSLIAIVNRLYMNANNDQLDENAISESKEDEIVEIVKSQTSLNSDFSSREASPNTAKNKIKPLLPSPPAIIPLSAEIATNGLTAIGGCRQCSRTFNDRLSLIHHFVDHFPTIFYSFESAASFLSSSLSSSSSSMLIPIMPSATTSSALGYSNVSQIVQTSSSSTTTTTKNNCGQPFASGYQSMMFFPYVSMNNINNNNINNNFNNHQQQSLKIKEDIVGAETMNPKKKKDSKAASNKNNNHGNESAKETSSSRFTDFNKSSNDLPYDMCPHCCQTFSDHLIYFEHLKTHDTPIITLGTSMPSEMSPLKCEYCDLRFSNEYLLKEHKKIHCRICSICSKTLMTAFDLNLHMGIHSGFSYDCKDCGRCFPDRKALAFHNKMHRSDLSMPDSDEEKNSPQKIVVTALLKENVKKTKIEKSPSIPFSVEDKPESFFKNNPYFENIFKQNPRKRRQRLHRNSTIAVVEGATENSNSNSKKKVKK